MHNSPRSDGGRDSLLGNTIPILPWWHRKDKQKNNGKDFMEQLQQAFSDSMLKAGRGILQKPAKVRRVHYNYYQSNYFLVNNHL